MLSHLKVGGISSHCISGHVTRRRKISKCALSDEGFDAAGLWCAMLLKPLNKVEFDKILKK